MIGLFHSSFHYWKQGEKIFFFLLLRKRGGRTLLSPFMVCSPPPYMKNEEYLDA